jgi:hypothetical protein
MASVKVRYLVEKRQRDGSVLYYWQPNRKLHEAGYRCRRLAPRTNDVLDAAREAEEINADVDAWRAGAKPEPLKPDSLPWLIRLYEGDEAFTKLAESTRRGYREANKRSPPQGAGYSEQRELTLLVQLLIA